MFFLLRTAFWLTIALALLPTGQTQQTAEATKVDPVDALVAAGSAVSDMSGFCQRQAQACEVGSQTAAVIGQRAMAGGKMVYEFINGQIVNGQHSDGQHGDGQTTASLDTGSLPRPRPLPDAPRVAAPQTTAAAATGSATAPAQRVRVVVPVPVPRSSRTTLTPTDLEPAWRNPIPRQAKSSQAKSS